jgi:hypothetical protein
VERQELETALQALQSSGSIETSRPSTKRLNDADYLQLTLIVKQMAQSYPAQDLSVCLEGYLWDYERLCLRYSMTRVMLALAELRIRPGQKFFPQPHEVAEEIERQKAAKLAMASVKDGDEYSRQANAHFWLWVEDRMAATGQTEQQVLDNVRTPGFTGRKQRAA